MKMKTIFTKKIIGLALSAFSISASAQCPTLTSMSVSLGSNGTATVTPILSSATSTLTMYYWSVTPNATQTSAWYQQNGTFQFPTNGNYTLSVVVNDSLNGCSLSGSTSLVISNMAATSCGADFAAYTDSSCVTHFTNSSVGTNLTFNWYINGNVFHSFEPAMNLPNGTHSVVLETFSNGVFCDSAFHSVYVGCNNSGTTTPCQASFTYYTDSTTCLTHFYNTTPCTYSTSSWNINGTNYYTSSPVVNLANGSYTAQLNASIVGSGVSTAFQALSINCSPSGTTTPSCVANANFQVFSDTITAGNYYAYNLSGGNGALSYLWSFGDGTTSTQQYPSHQYATPGQYVICLTVTNLANGLSCSDTHCDSSSTQRVAAGFLMSQFNVIPQSTTGVKQTELISGLKAYPNPLADELFIEATSIDNASLTFVLTDAVGRNVKSGSLNGASQKIVTSDLAKGFYTLSISHPSGNNLKTIKLVK